MIRPTNLPPLPLPREESTPLFSPASFASMDPWPEASTPLYSPASISSMDPRSGTSTPLFSAASFSLTPHAVIPLSQTGPSQTGPTENVPAAQGKEHWDGKIATHQQAFITKVSAFIILSLMRDRSAAGCEDKDNARLMQLVQKATEGTNPPSIWKLFTEAYALTWIEKIKAACLYWVLYRTSLIENTVTAYLGSFIGNMRRDLTSDNSETRARVFRIALENIHDALRADNKAKENFANGVDHKTLRDGQHQAIAEVYQFSLAELCKKFSEKRLSQDAPMVRMFTDAQNIPLIGRIFQKVEWLVNRLIIQGSMKAILPGALELIIEKGLQATGSQHLPFALKITQLFTSQLSAFKEELEKQMSQGTEAPTAPIATILGTEALSPVVKELIRALDLERNEKGLPHIGATGAAELKQQIAAIEKRDGPHPFWDLGNKLDQIVEGAIQESLEEGGNLLFNHLDEMTKSGELFATVLELASSSFSGEYKDHETLLAEYKQEYAKFEELGKEVVGKIISHAIEKTVQGEEPAATAEVFHGVNTPSQETSGSLLPPLSTQQALFGIAGGAVGVALPWVGGAVGSLFGPIGTAVGATLGTFASASIQPVAQNLSGLRNGTPGTVSKIVKETLPFAAASLAFGGIPLVTAASGMHAGITHKKVMHTYGQETVLPRIDRIRQNAYALVKSRRVYKMCITRALHALS